jgi:hypothetical protein
VVRVGSASVFWACPLKGPERLLGSSILRMGGEGISGALATGWQAGQAIVDAVAHGGDALARYQAGTRAERERVLDQWSFTRLGRSFTHPWALRSAAIPGATFPTLMREAYQFLDQQARGSGVGAAMIRNSWRRLLARRRYEPSRV